MSLILFYSVDSTCFILQILWHLYDKDIIGEEAILKWDDEKKDADDSDKVFVKQSEKFIQVSIINNPFHFVFSKKREKNINLDCYISCLLIV